MFRMRMRKPLPQEKLTTTVDLDSVTLKSKVVEVTIVEAFDLKTAGQPSKKPFFSFQFYTFETKSKTGEGANPKFNASRAF